MAEQYEEEQQPPEGGGTHHVAGPERAPLTTQLGVPVKDDQNRTWRAPAQTAPDNFWDFAWLMP